MLFRMNISYALVVHNNVPQFERLINKLQASDVAFFVHVDAKTDIKPFENATQHYNNVHYVEDRCSVRWGDYSVLEAYLLCLRLIREMAPNSFVLHISGSDYPLKSNRQIADFIDQNADRIFIKHFKLPYDGWAPEQGMSRTHYWAFNLDQKQQVLLKPLDFTWSNVRQLAYILYRHTGSFAKMFFCFFTKRRYPFDVESLYGGEFWMSMPESVSSSVLNFLDRNPKVVKYYSHCQSPDETLLQTVLLNNAEFKDHIENNCLKLIEWEGGKNGSPITFTMEQKEQITKAINEPSKLFARKFDPSTDSAVLDYIDSLIR